MFQELSLDDPLDVDQIGPRITLILVQSRSTRTFLHFNPKSIFKSASTYKDDFGEKQNSDDSELASPPLGDNASLDPGGFKVCRDFLGIVHLIFLTLLAVRASEDPPRRQSQTSLLAHQLYPFWKMKSKMSRRAPEKKESG